MVHFTTFDLHNGGGANAANTTTAAVAMSNFEYEAALNSVFNGASAIAFLGKYLVRGIRTALLGRRRR